MIDNNMLNDANNRYYNVANDTLNEILNLSDEVEYQREEIANDYQHQVKFDPKGASYRLNQSMTNLVNNSMKSIKDIMHTYQPIADKEWFDEADAETNAQLNKHNE